MDTILDPILGVPIRIRFAGTTGAETFHMTRSESARFHMEWKAYLAGSGAIGNEYACEEAEHPLVIALNFNQIVYIEPGKIY